MALTRKMLVAMDIPAEKIEEIINAHVETVTALKEERDNFKTQAAENADLQKKLDDLDKELKEIKAGDWEKKYNDLKSEYTTFKTDTETKATKAAKETAYRKLLLDAGISEKRIPSILKVTDVDSVELADDGVIKDADKLTESIKTEWADFIATEGKKGAETPTPPAGGEGTKVPSIAKQLAEQYQREHYGSLAKSDKED